jgi:peptidoglycan/xylan/chitin deacetylase (PgdA/CDA1 family)
MKRIAIVAVSLGVFTIDLFLRGMGSLIGRKTPTAPIFLAYHSVSSENRGAFARQMGKLARHSQSRNGAFVHADNGNPRVTFDDGFQNIIENALPELRQRGIPATVFVVSGALGATPNWTDFSGGADPEMGEPLLTAEQLRSLPCDLVEIGSHTVTHPQLPAMSEQQARTELAASRTMLEQITGRKVKLFSFPYGSANAELVKWCREEGYEHVFITHPRHDVSGSNGVVARVKVDPGDWPLEFHLKLHGAYRWRNRWRDFLRSWV